MIEGGDLDFKVLVGGAYAGIADDGHGSGRVSFGSRAATIPSQNFKSNPIETRIVPHGDASVG